MNSVRICLLWWNNRVVYTGGSFFALFQGLPDNTRLAEIIRIRLSPMPKPTKYNSEERQRLLWLKNEYQLKTSEAQRQENYQQGLQKLAYTLVGIANDGKRKD